MCAWWVAPKIYVFGSKLFSRWCELRAGPPSFAPLCSYRNAIGWLYRNVSLSSSDLWRFSWVYAAASLIFQFRRVHDGDFVSTTKDNRDRGVFFAWSVSLQSFYIEEGIGTWLHLGREASMKVMGAFTPVSIDGRFHKSYGSVPSLV